VACFWSKLAYFRYNIGMSSIGRPSAPATRLARDFTLILLGAALVVGLLGLFRLGRQFPAAASTPALLVPFLLPVLALALEAGALVALSTVQLRELLRGVAPDGRRAVLARARATVPLLALLGLVLSATETIPRGTEHPGAFANELVQTARGSCGTGVKVVPVPLLGLSVSCDAGRIEGPMPGVQSIQVAMRELTFSDDLRRVDIVGLELTAARALRVHLVAGGARIAGLAPWSRSPRLSALGRFAILAALGATLWLAATLGWGAGSGSSSAASVAPSSARPPAPDERGGRGRRTRSLLATLVLAVPGTVVAAGFISLDQERAAPPIYASAALLGVVALGLVRLLAWRVPRIFSSFQAF
jgi:hypothetical protein